MHTPHGAKWRSTGWYINPSSPRRLLSTIGAIGGFSASANIAWRGISSCDYDLTSSLQRRPDLGTEEELRRAEIDLLESARAWGLGYGGGTGWMSDLQLLADLQHYGTSTRLIDVTSNPMTALWFACQTPKHVPGSPPASRHGILLAINTKGWPRYGRQRPAGTYSAIEDPMGWELDHALRDGSPFVVESLTPNDRLRAQEGFFLAGQVPGRDLQRGPFQSLRIPFKPADRQLVHDALLGNESLRSSLFDKGIPFMAVKVREELKPRLKRILENSYNRSPRVLFPDFAGFRDYSEEADPRELVVDTSKRF